MIIHTLYDTITKITQSMDNHNKQILDEISKLRISFNAFSSHTKQDSDTFLKIFAMFSIVSLIYMGISIMKDVFALLMVMLTPLMMTMSSGMNTNIHTNHSIY